MVELIAEMCQNHNGNYEILARMVEKAALAGATHAKIQNIFSSTLTYRPQFEQGLIVDGSIKSIKRPYQAEKERLRDLELSDILVSKFIRLCSDNGLVPMTTCFTRSDIKHIKMQGFQEVKVASYDCASYPLLRELRQHFDRVIVSTGATYDDEIAHASSILQGSTFSFLHCVTIYPTPLEEVHLNRMEWLRKFTPSIGFSDHTLVKRHGCLASKAALASGATLIERHFTILDTDQTKDGPVSITPSHLKELREFSKMSTRDQLEQLDRDYPGWRVMLGRHRRVLSDAELLNRDYYRGRFASPRASADGNCQMIYNWEETPLA